jgi:glycosyltransferase involved in cell wall biosynthesis
MKVVYLVGCFEGANSGVGGHYYSLSVLSKAMSCLHEVKILVLGNKNVEALDGLDLPIEKIEFVSLKDQAGLEALKANLRECSPDVLHSFDLKAHPLAQAVSAELKIPHVITKPGGGPGRYRYPLARDIILFTKEELSWLKGHPAFRNVRLHLIPNRVARPKANSTRLMELSPRIKPDHFVFLAIARATEGKEHQLVQAIHLVEDLAERGMKVQLVIIADPHDLGVIRRLAKIAKENTVLLHEKPYIVKASVYLPLADIVIAMGRGVMEAAALGKPVMSSSEGARYPFLLNDQNFDVAFAANFTSRSGIVASDEETFDCISKLIRNRDQYALSVQFIEERFTRYFEIDTVVHQYEEIYQNAKLSSRRSFEPYFQYMYEIFLGGVYRYLLKHRSHDKKP